MVQKTDDFFETPLSYRFYLAASSVEPRLLMPKEPFRRFDPAKKGGTQSSQALMEDGAQVTSERWFRKVDHGPLQEAHERDSLGTRLPRGLPIVIEWEASSRGSRPLMRWNAC